MKTYLQVIDVGACYKFCLVVNSEKYFFTKNILVDEEDANAIALKIGKELNIPVYSCLGLEIGETNES